MEDENTEVTEVPVNEATDDQLDNFINSQLNNVESYEQEVSTEAEAETDKIKAVEDERTGEIEERIESKKTETIEERARRLEAALAKQTQEVQRRGTEIGQLRKELQERNRALLDGLEEKALLEPLEAIDRKLEAAKNNEALRELDKHEGLLNSRNEAMSLVLTNVSEGEFDIDSMAESLRRDGAQESFLSSFRADPFAGADGLTLIQLAKRAAAEKALIEVASYAKRLEEALRAAKQGKSSQEIVRKIEKATQSKPITAGASTPIAKSASVRLSDISSLSDSQLEELINSNR